MMRVYVEGIGLRAPGLEGWAASRPVLCGERAYSPTPLNLPPIELLPANERRRMVTTVKLALATGVEAFAMAKRDPSETATVFTSSGGDGETICNILETLASAQLDVSPTRFHNSVHNAPAGYWSIATKAQAPTTALCAHDGSFSAGLLDAVSQAVADNHPVGLVAYDIPYPEPIDSVRSIHNPLGAALVVAPMQTENSFAALRISLARKPMPWNTMEDAGLEALRCDNPAARCLPLLAALARGRETSVVLDYVGGNVVAVSVSPIRA